MMTRGKQRPKSALKPKTIHWRNSARDARQWAPDPVMEARWLAEVAPVLEDELEEDNSDARTS